jgi:hypothetical protein
VASALAVGIFVVGATVAGVVLTARTGRFEWLFLALPFSLVLWALGLAAPRGYRLAADGVHVERRAGTTVIPYRSIRSVDRDPRPLGGLSLFGSKGVFGRFGRFWSPRLGAYRLFVTDGTAVVWLATDDGLVGLSPDRSAEFVDRLRERLGRRDS